ncbi:MAG TPA: hypothetical protein VF163_04925 [Micromonosporaceae bacterium]
MRRMIACALISVLLAGCALGEVLGDDGEPADLAVTDVVGSWRSGSSRSITFAKDRGFVAVDLPYPVFEDFVETDFDPSRARLDGSGTWRLTNTSDQAGAGGSKVLLRFTSLAGESIGPVEVELTALRRDDVVSLIFFYVGSGGNSWTAYQRCGSACGSASPRR